MAVEVTAKMVKALRDKTAAGMMDCKKALVEAEGDMDKAIDVLREKGLSKVAKKADRIAAEGLIGLAVSQDGKTAAAVEINSETDFVAKNQEFKDFVLTVANIVITHNPKDLDALMECKYEDEGTVKDVLNNKISKIGENMNIRRFKVVSVEEGRVVSYLHGNGKIASLIKLETPSTSEEIEVLGKDIAMQTAAMSPKFISSDDVDKDYVAHEKEVLKQQAINENNELPENKRKSEDILLKMLEGRLRKELKEVCLLDQAFVKEPKKSVADVVKEYEKNLSTTIKVAEMVRFEVGEGIEKKVEDFAEEVAKQMGN